MKKSHGFTLIELIGFLVVIAMTSLVILIVVGAFGNAILNNPGYTEDRAIVNAGKFIKQNNFTVIRTSCAGDSDGNGYATCVLTLADGGKIMIGCPVGYFSVNWFGADQCKEVFNDLQFSNARLYSERKLEDIR